MPVSFSMTLVFPQKKGCTEESYLDELVVRFRQTWMDICQKVTQHGYQKTTGPQVTNRPSSPRQSHAPRISPLSEYELILDFIVERDAVSSRIRKRCSLHEDPPFRDFLRQNLPQERHKMQCVLSVFHNKSHSMINLADSTSLPVPIIDEPYHPSFFIEQQKGSLSTARRANNKDNPLTDDAHRGVSLC